MATILVVDDDTVTRVVLRHMLERADHDVIEAVDGIEAMELLDAERVDLIISDQEMPHLSGLELRRALGERFRGPFVLLTGYATEDEFEADDLASVDAYLTKPIASSAMADLLASLGL